MNHKPDPDHLFKILLIGNDFVGKTSLLARFAANTFTFNTIPTTGIDYKSRTLNIDGQAVKLLIWDTSGQERCKTVIRNFYKGAHSILLVYDICDRQSFEELDDWLKDIKEYAEDDVKKLLIGSKCDLEEKRQVAYEEGKAYADKLGIKFAETSAKDNVDVENAFTTIAKELMIGAQLARQKVPLKKLRNEDDATTSYWNSIEMNLHKDYDHLFKILLIGNLNVGKTSLILRFADPDRSEDYHPVIGIDFRIRNLKLNDKVIKCQIWDTAGQERFKTITSSYYRGAHGIFLVYDVNDRQSFIDLDKWLADIKKNVDEGVPKLLIGNKCDSEKERQVSEEEGKAYAEKLGIRFVETSAKHTTNIDEALLDLVNQLVASTQMSSHGAVGTRLSRNDAEIAASESSKRCC